MITPFAAKRAAEICATLRTCPQGYREGLVASRVVWSVAEAIQRTTADASLFDSQTGYVVALVMAPKERGTVFLVGSNRLFVAMRRMDSGSAPLQRAAA